MPTVFRRISKFVMLPLLVDVRTAFDFYLLFFISIPSMIYAMSLAPFREKVWNKKCTFLVFRKKIILKGSAFFGYGNEIYIEKKYFPSSDFKITPDMTVIDLGANVGVFTVLAAMLGKRVIAVEILQDLVGEIKKNVVVNNCANKVIVICGAIGYNIGHTVREAAANVNKLEMEDIIKKHNISIVDFLKIDIEGSEFDVIKKDSDWLLKVKLIAIEIHTEYGDARNLKNILEEKGFEVNLVDQYLFAKNTNKGLNS